MSLPHPGNYRAVTAARTSRQLGRQLRDGSEDAWADVLDAYREAGTDRGAAEQLGVSASTLRRWHDVGGELYVGVGVVKQHS